MTDDLNALQREWNARLKAEGLGATPSTEPPASAPVVNEPTPTRRNRFRTKKQAKAIRQDAASEQEQRRQEMKVARRLNRVRTGIAAADPAFEPERILITSTQKNIDTSPPKD